MSRHPLPAEQLPAAGEHALLEVDGHGIALFNLDGRLHAIADNCPHQGSSLCAGQLQGQAHGLRLDLANSDRLRVATYPIEEEGGRFFIVIACEVSAP